MSPYAGTKCKRLCAACLVYETTVPRCSASPLRSAYVLRFPPFFEDSWLIILMKHCCTLITTDAEPILLDCIRSLICRVGKERKRKVIGGFKSADTPRHPLCGVKTVARIRVQAWKEKLLRKTEKETSHTGPKSRLNFHLYTAQNIGRQPLPKSKTTAWGRRFSWENWSHHQTKVIV